MKNINEFDPQKLTARANPNMSKVAEFARNYSTGNFGQSTLSSALKGSSPNTPTRPPNKFFSRDQIKIVPSQFVPLPEETTREPALDLKVLQMTNYVKKGSFELTKEQIVGTAPDEVENTDNEHIYKAFAPKETYYMPVEYILLEPSNSFYIPNDED